MGTDQGKVERIAAAPAEASLGVSGCPHVERGEVTDNAPVVDRPLLDDLGPCADANAVGLGEVALRGDFDGGRLAFGPDAFLHRAFELRLVALSDQLGAVEVEGRVEEEAVVLEVVAATGLLNVAVADDEQLLAFCECPDGYGPILVGDRHEGAFPVVDVVSDGGVRPGRVLSGVDERVREFTDGPRKIKSLRHFSV
jgi:hypothetical protein